MKIKESLYIFAKYQSDITFLFQTLIDLGYHLKGDGDWTPKERVHYVTIYNTVLLNICSFLEEYDNHFLAFAENEFKERILRVKKIAKPAYNKVKEWRELKQYRNNIIAHTLRIDKKDFSLSKLGDYDSPRTYLDLVIIRKYFMMIYTIILMEFEEELSSINNFVRNFNQKNPPRKHENAAAELNNVVKKINVLLEESNSKNFLLLDQFEKL